MNERAHEQMLLGQLGSETFLPHILFKGEKDLGFECSMLVWSCLDPRIIKSA